MANDETTSGPSRGVATPSGGKLKRYTVDMPGMRPSGPGSGWQLREVIGGPVVRYDDAAAALAEKDDRLAAVEAERVTLKGRLDIANTAYSETYVRSEEMKAERDRAVAERDELRAFVEWEAQRWWAGPEPDGFDWQDEADRRGLLVSVPADEAHMAEHGDDAEEMFVLRWIAAREPDAEEPTGDTPIGVGCPECGEVFRMDGHGCCVTCGTAIPGYGADAEDSGGEGDNV